VTGIERRLAAADLRSRKLHLEAGLAQEGVGIRDRFRKDEVAEARCEELDSRHATRPHHTA
jgi:hypothetical protein